MRYSMKLFAVLFVLLAAFTAACGGTVSGKSPRSKGSGSGSGSSAPAVSAVSAVSAAALTTTIPGSAVQLTLNRIPAGTFTIGSPENEPGREPYAGADETQHSVTLTKGFYMGKHEVTQEQYAAVMGANPSYFQGESELPDADEVQAKRPVEWVSWFDAIVFCNKLSTLLNRVPVYSIDGKTDPAEWGEVPASPGHENYETWNAVVMNTSANGYRLPTEAEWEYACRAGKATAFHCGTATPAPARYAEMEAGYAAIVDALGWRRDNSGYQTREVGKKTPNAWGLYDMHGNVWEWCWDWFENFTSSAVTDPVGPVSGANRVFRGGSWLDDAQHLRSAYRGSNSPDLGKYYFGFRLVRGL